MSCVLWFQQDLIETCVRKPIETVKICQEAILQGIESQYEQHCGLPLVVRLVQVSLRVTTSVEDESCPVT